LGYSCKDCRIQTPADTGIRSKSTVGSKNMGHVMKTKVRRSKSAGGVVVNQQGKVILTREGSRWFLPKGVIKKGESEIGAAKREVAEETGVTDLRLVKKLGRYQRYQIRQNGADNQSVIKTITMFLFETKQKNLKPIDQKEIDEARWLDKDKVAGLLFHPKDKAFFLKIKAKIKVQ